MQTWAPQDSLCKAAGLEMWQRGQPSASQEVQLCFLFSWVCDFGGFVKDSGVRPSWHSHKPCSCRAQTDLLRHTAFSRAEHQGASPSAWRALISLCSGRVWICIL